MQGNGEPLLLLHGFTGSGGTWKDFKTILQKYKLIMIDIIGHGKTDSPEDPNRYRVEEAADDLKEILRKFDIHQAHFLGYSMGGRLALSFANIYPEYVKSLILESCSPGLKTEEERLARKERDEKLANMIIEKGIPSFVNYWENIPLFESQKSLPLTVKKRMRAERLQNQTLGLANSLRGMGTGVQPSWWNHLENLTVPVLLISGGKDEKFFWIMKEMNNLIPTSIYKVVPEAGHAVHVEQPEIFGKIVDEFLQHFS